MDLSYPTETEAFRTETRTWIEAHLPGRSAVEWNDLLHQTGWAVPRWPVEHGGRGLTTVEAVIWSEELQRAGAPIQPPAGGELLLGPTVLQWGTDAQKERFLLPIARGEEVWCQGFSEPDAGSDLAGLRTTARLDGDEWVVDGHKVWTSQAQEADLMFTLVRTNPDAPKHRGISYLAVPMDQPGVEVRSIVQPDGTAGFSEVLLAGARAPRDNVVGGVDNGWTVAMSTLGLERGTSSVSSWQRWARDWDAIVIDARARGRLDDPVLRQRLARAWSDIQLMRMSGYRVLTGVLHPELADRSAALEAGTKTVWTELQQRLTNLGMDVGGMASTILVGGDAAPGVGLGHREVVHPYPAGELQSGFLFSLAGTIFGGTAQVQRNILAERVLGLPKDPERKTGR
ncbi:MAG: putative acyl-CoA dehydrogenase [Actinomycetia bacterium]|nr:putative acyl-CoA dehydrogenase [Actinomycetes bacterium]